MDPTANLQEQRKIAKEIIRLRDKDGGDSALVGDLADRLAELVTALDEWIMKGGFPPRQWDDAHRALRSTT